MKHSEYIVGNWVRLLLTVDTVVEDFCYAISHQTIPRDMRRLVYAVSYIRSTGLDSLCRSMAALDNYDTVAELFRMNPEGLSQYMSTFNVAKHQEASNEVWTRIIRQRIILHEYRLACTVNDMESTLCDEIFSRDTFHTQPSNWIERLLRDIHVKLVVQLPMDLKSSAYIKHAGAPNVRYVEPDWALKERQWRKRPSDADFLVATAKYFGRILRSWFDLPSGFITRGRSQLVDTLVGKFGKGVLFLERVWELHRSLPRYLFKNPPYDYHTNSLNKDRPYDPSAMDDFVSAIQSVDATVEDDAQLLYEFYDSFVRLSQTYSTQLLNERVHQPGTSVAFDCM